MDGLQEIENKKLSYEEVVKHSHEQLVRQAIELPYLQHLNDDCLLEIFSVKSLDLLDLCSLAETCKRFQAITQRVFPKDLPIKIETSGDDCSFKTKNYFTNRGHDIERIFKNFGSILYKISIRIDNNKYSSEAMMLFLLSLLSEYCVGTLKVLNISGMTITKVLTVKFNAISKRLQKLNLNVVYIEDDKTLFADCVSLIELSVNGVENCRTILENNFPKLERLSYTQTAEATKQLLSTFISRHPSLKMLNLRFRRENHTFKNVVEEIGNSCKELEELTIGMWQHTISSIQELQAVKSLKTLKLRNASCHDFEFMTALTNLRELHLLACHFPEDLNQFAFLTQLTKLHIIQHWNQLGSFDVVEIIRHLKNLEEMTIRIINYNGRGLIVLDEKTFSEIVAVVRGRPKVLTLECDFDFKNYDENQNVRLVKRLNDLNKFASLFL